MSFLMVSIFCDQVVGKQAVESCTGKRNLKISFDIIQENYDFLDGPPAPLNNQLMEKVNHYNLTKKINFSMGPSVKFVLAIIDSISKKIWV